MFKFDFDLDDAEPLEDLGFDHPQQPSGEPTQNPAVEYEPSAEISITQLLDTLPTLISYSPLPVPLTGSTSITLVRRDLFDARFQLISEGAGDEDPNEQEEEDGAVSNPAPSEPDSRDAKKALEFLEAPSDLVPGVYEGGLKTWECSLDVVQYLGSVKSDGYKFLGKRILEIGCGTAIPSLYVLRELLSSTALSEAGKFQTEIHLQDYNGSVLELVTLPNLLLTWYASNAADAYRAQLQASNADSEETPLFIDPNTPGELHITAELKAAFLVSLEKCGITLRFFSGSWSSFKPQSLYDVVLTSETIYHLGSLDVLIGLMAECCGCPLGGGHGPAVKEDIDEVKALQNLDLGKDEYMCIVAAKVLYFGVGGGVPDFVERVEKYGGRIRVLLEHNIGVGRTVVRVHWA